MGPLLTGANGKYSFGFVQPGQYVLVVSKDGADVKTTEQFDVEIGATVPRAIEIGVKGHLFRTRTDEPSKGVITGSIIDSAARAPLNGATVTLRNPDTNAVLQTVIADSGTYQFAGVDPGPYFIRAESPGYVSSDSYRLSLAGGQTLHASLFLKEVQQVPVPNPNPPKPVEEARQQQVPPFSIPSSTTQTKRVGDPPTNPASVPSAVAHDSLIVTVPASFRPSISPKLLDRSGRVIYGEKTLSPWILVTRGVAHYASSTAAARSILKSLGANDPLQLNAATPRTSTAQLSDADLAQLQQADQATSLLSKGHVVFVISAR